MRLRNCLMLFLLLCVSSCSSTKNFTEEGATTVFDVHLHGSKDIDSQIQDLKSSGVKIGAVSTSWDMQTHYNNRAGIKILLGLMLPCPDGKVPYSLQSCFDNGNEWPDLHWVEQQMINKKIDFIGEVLSQYYGISSSDSLLFPYYALAAKYDLPVGIHTGGAGQNHGSPNFKYAMGNPELLRVTLLKFPRLRIWLMHAGDPFWQEAIVIMKEFPNVYTDISVIDNPEIVSAEDFKEIMKALIDAGLEDRIMFGSDNASLSTTITSVHNLHFLSPEQKEKIFYKNAQAFFKQL